MKRKILQISPDFLLEFIRKPIPPGITSEGLPADAKIVRFSASSSTIDLLVESAEFIDEGYLKVLFHHNVVGK